MMRPKFITVHCSATLPSFDITIETIRRWHKAKGWRDIGYHYVIDVFGAVHRGRNVTETGAHVAGHNKDNIGICLIGGVDANGKATDNFTSDQKHALRMLIRDLASTYKIVDDNIKGHRDWSPDLNGDGYIQASERIKECPCFDVREFLRYA